MLDAPVSGGEPKAIDGTLSVMVGGDKAIFDKYYDLMKAMAGSVVHTGDIGAGNVTKLANQVIVALNIAAMSGSADSGDQSWRQSGSGLSGDPWRPGGQYRAGCQSADGDGSELPSRDSVSTCILKIWRTPWIRPMAWALSCRYSGGDGDDAGAARRRSGHRGP